MSNHLQILLVNRKQNCVLPSQVLSFKLDDRCKSLAMAAGLYKFIWKPQSLGISKAADLVQPLKKGLALLTAGSDIFQAGWDSHDCLVRFVDSYLQGCKDHPAALVTIQKPSACD